MSAAQPAWFEHNLSAAELSSSWENFDQEQRTALEVYSFAVAPAAREQFQRYIARQTVIFNESLSLSGALERQSESLPTEVVSGLNDAELFWREIQSEFGFLTSLEVAEALGASASRSYASDQRKSGKLIALRRLNKFVYPGFQINDGTVRPVIARLVQLAQERDRDERAVVAWLCRPTTYIRGGGRPVDHLDDPDLVLNAAASAWGVIW